jgi:HAMP domain-containing protein
MSTASVEHVLADSPALARALEGQLRLHLALTILASLAFFAALAVIGGLDRHRREGAAEKLVTHLERVEHGDYRANLRLRSDDRLDRLEQAFNRMSRALFDRTSHEAERLEQLAQLAIEAESADERSRLHTEIRELAVNLRRVLDSGRV